MIEPLKRELMTARLPRAACSEATLTQVKDIAVKKKTSVAAVIRHAISVFLSTYNPDEGEITLLEVNEGDTEEVPSE